MAKQMPKICLGLELEHSYLLGLDPGKPTRGIENVAALLGCCLNDVGDVSGMSSTFEVSTFENALWHLHQSFVNVFILLSCAQQL